jgi:endonuclease/exonuclease/phosphatase family metal-dependent hydrolase
VRSGQIALALLAVGLPMPAESSRLKVASLNLAKERHVDRMIAELQQSPELRQADVLLLQEVMVSVPDRLAEGLGCKAVYAPADAHEGLAILSRFSMRDRKVIRLPQNRLHVKTRPRIALALTVAAPLGPLRIFNVHLDNRINSERKVEQLGPVFDAAAAWSGPEIIGGDFNTGNFLWVSHLLPLPAIGGQPAAVRREMEARGFRSAFTGRVSTFDHFGLQLDWLYVQKLGVSATGVRKINFSDHHAIWADFD